MRVCLFAWLLIGSTILTNAVAQDTSAATSADQSLSPASLGATKNVHAFGLNLLCGQPTEAEFATAKQRGIKTVITLRQPGEIDWDEPEIVRALGLEFHRLGFAGPENLTDEIFDQSLKLMSNAEKSPVMLHCASANRVGAIWLAHRVLNDKIDIEAARAEAKTVGLRTAGYEDKAIAYIQQRGKKPGLNDRFLDPNLDMSEWLGRFELESREVYAARERVLTACNLKPGMQVADVGAGTGFYSRLFATTVGDDGWVYAVDISPRFLQHINDQSFSDGIHNMTGVLCSDRSIRLPPNSVDVVFICDTYHHFEYPESTLASIHQALRPGGTLVVIDFEWIPGTSREFILGHVRAGKDVFQREIIDAGFEFTNEVKVPSFQENYLLRFNKK